MAINMMCTNSECKYYFEDCCQRNLEELRHEIGSSGKCVSFLPGVCSYYDQTGIEIEQEESRWIELEIPKARRSLKNRKKQEIYTEVERVLIHNGFGILYGNTYSVTVIADCEGRGKQIAECRTLAGAYTIIKMINTFFPNLNSLLVEGDLKKASIQVSRVRQASRQIIGEHIWAEEIF
jgi:hypothetical protein